VTSEGNRKKFYIKLACGVVLAVVVVAGSIYWIGPEALLIGAADFISTIGNVLTNICGLLAKIATYLQQHIRLIVCGTTASTLGIACRPITSNRARVKNE
jgi:hypothetical protein